MFGLTGCALNAALTENKVRSKLELNMTENQVLKLLGKPMKILPYVENDNKATETWIYRTYYFITYPEFNKEEQYTTLYFKDGLLVGWYGIDGRGLELHPNINDM